MREATKGTIGFYLYTIAWALSPWLGLWSVALLVPGAYLIGRSFARMREPA